jgi:hypothetical protein
MRPRKHADSQSERCPRRRGTYPSAYPRPWRSESQSARAKELCKTALVPAPPLYTVTVLALNTGMRHNEISNWRTAWRRATTLIRCPSCAQLQDPGKTCKNEECQADVSNIKSSIDGLRFHDLRHTAATKLLEQGTPYPVVAQILGWSASTAVRMAKRYGHIRPEAQRRALEGVATAEIQRDVNQIVNQVSDAVESRLPN